MVKPREEEKKILLRITHQVRGSTGLWAVWDGNNEAHPPTFRESSLGISVDAYALLWSSWHLFLDLGPFKRSILNRSHQHVQRVELNPQRIISFTQVMGHPSAPPILPPIIYLLIIWD